MFDFSPHIHTKWRVLTSWWLSGIMGPWRSIRVFFSRNLLKSSFFLVFKNPFFFNLTPKKEFQGYESDRYVKKLHFFSIFRIFKFWSILTTFDPVLTWKRTVQKWAFSVFPKSTFQKMGSKGGRKCRKVEFSIFPRIYIKKRVFWYLDHSVAPAELGDQFGSKSSKISEILDLGVFTP